MIPLRLNIGCGFAKRDGWLNVDKYDNCQPDVVWDLDQTPWPWEDNTFFEISAFHIMEHLDNWWDAFCECSRVLRVNGILTIAVPHESSRTALGYRDHKHVFTQWSFHGIHMRYHGASAWAETEMEKIPLHMLEIKLIPLDEYMWMLKIPWLLKFCANHMRNFVWEQQFIFQKINLDREI